MFSMFCVIGGAVLTFDTDSLVDKEVSHAGVASCDDGEPYDDAYTIHQDRLVQPFAKGGETYQGG